VPTSSIEAGVLVFDERLILICTFYRGKAGASFDEKKAKFILKGGPLGSCEHGAHFTTSLITVNKMP
jgi:hypothetical protein